MNADIKLFQKRYGLSNKDMANVCMCSLPTIQKWRSGDVSPAGPAQQLMRLLDYSADGDPAKLRNLLRSMSKDIGPAIKESDEDLVELESSMTKVMDRLELMLETRRKERELAESEARYRSMVESQEDPICRWLPDTTLTYVNEAYASLFSAFGENLIGRRWMEFIPESKRDAVSALVSDMVRRGEPEITIHDSVDKDGKVIHQQWRDIPIKNQRGDVVELHSVGKDISQIKRLGHDLEDSQRLLDSLMKLCDHPILVLDGEGNFLQMNEYFKKEVISDKSWSSLEEMMESSKVERFKRLLNRVSGKGQMLYRLILEDTVWSLRICLLPSSYTKNRFLAIFEKEDSENSRSVIQTRLSSEIIIGGEPVEFPIKKQERKALESEMAKLGKTTQVDRIYVFTFDWEEEVFDNILEWCATGIEPHIDDLKRIPISEYQWWVKRLKKDQWIKHDDVNQLPRTASQEKDILKAQGIRSILVAPFKVNEELAGFVGFDQNTHIRVWHNQEVKALEAFRDRAAELVSRASR